MAVSLVTEDKLEYNFYPCSSGQIQFRVKAPNDAHIALTTGPHEGEPMYEVFIGGWGNSKSVIRKNRTKPEVAEKDTPGILSGDEHRGFWIRWHSGNISVGEENNQTPLLTYYDPAPFNISYFGVCTGWGANGEWHIEGTKNLTTPNELKYTFHPVTSGCVIIDVKAKSNAHIALTRAKFETSPMYEVLLGGWDNTASVIRYDRKQPDKVRVNTPNLLSSSEHRKFAIMWHDGLITVRSGDQHGKILLEWKDPEPIGISHVGVRTAWGATGNWRMHFDNLPHTRSGSSSRPQHPNPSAPSVGSLRYDGGASWCDGSGGIIPPGALEGGQDGEPLYVGRASHEGALIPGKVKPSHGVCYVAWGGGEHAKSEYQILCGGNGRWVPMNGGEIPPTAIPAGETEDGEPLFIGRVHHEGTLTIGKVQASHNVCYIPYGGAEIPFNQYEILID
ncbi:uncharacterized protein LOC135169750 isoform X1 [Diachasmimorpha longicaudata]|uniref:uncharacterized protein LOC135169750 isoform X1 n=1 Tax=Diachasmimorpha longicaudata TaxID=58733 RepID=UPI0030B8ABBD